MKSLIAVLCALICPMFATLAFADKTKVSCEELLKQDQDIANQNEHLWRSFPQSRVSLLRRVDVKSKGIFRFEAEVRVEDRLRQQGKEVQSLLSVTIMNNPIPLFVNLDEVLGRWGLERTSNDRAPVSVEIQDAKPVDGSQPGIELSLVLHAPAFAKINNSHYLKEATGRYALRLVYQPDSLVPLSETYRVRLEALPAIKESNRIELYDPRRAHSVTNTIRYKYVNAVLQLSENKKTAYLKVESIGKGEELLEDEIKTSCSRDCSLVFSTRINNLHSFQIGLPEYFSANSPDNTLVYVVGTAGSVKEPSKVFVYKVSENPVSRNFEISKKEYVGPIGYALRKIDQNRNKVSFYFEHLDSRFASSLLVESKKEVLIRD